MPGILDTTLRWCSEYKTLIESVKRKPWARVIDLTYWELTTPDVWECVDEVNTWANTHNQKYDVVICPLPVQRHVLERAHQVLTNVEIKFCDNLLEAYQWLELQGMSSSKLIQPDL